MKLKLLLLCSFGISACQTNPLERFVSAYSGTFDTAAASPAMTGDDRLVSRHVRLEAPGIGEHVFYQEIRHGEPLSVYRQRILVLNLASDGTIRQTAYTLKDAEAFAGTHAAAFSELDMQALEPSLPDGCEQVYRKQVDGFHGYVDPETCIIVSSRSGKLRRIEAEARVSQESLQQAERGYDAESNEQLFGTAPGEYLTLARVPERS